MEFGKAARDLVAELGTVGYSGRVVYKSVVADKRQVVHHDCAERYPLDLGLYSNDHSTAVSDWHRTVWRNGRVLGAAPIGLPPTVARVVGRCPHPFGERIEERHFDVRALAVLDALVKSGEDPGEGIHAGGDVCDRN